MLYASVDIAEYKMGFLISFKVISSLVVLAISNINTSFSISKFLICVYSIRIEIAKD